MPGDQLGDAVLDLDAAVDLHEVEAAVLVEQELHRAGVAVADVARRPCAASSPMRLRWAGVQAGRGRLLHDLLAPTLEGAVALAERQRRAVVVRQELDLDVVRVARRAAPGTARRCRRSSAPPSGRAGTGAVSSRSSAAGADAAPAAAGDGLDHQRVADLAGDLDGVVDAVQRLVGAGHGRDAGLLHQPAGGQLVAEALDDVAAAAR